MAKKLGVREWHRYRKKINATIRALNTSWSLDNKAVVQQHSRGQIDKVLLTRLKMYPGLLIYFRDLLDPDKFLAAQLVDFDTVLFLVEELMKARSGYRN